MYSKSNIKVNILLQIIVNKCERIYLYFVFKRNELFKERFYTEQLVRLMNSLRDLSL